MSHPNLRRTTVKRAAAVTLAGAAILLPSAAIGQVVTDLGADAACDTELAAVAAAACAAVESAIPAEVTAPVEEAAAPVADVVEESAPVLDAVEDVVSESPAGATVEEAEEPDATPADAAPQASPAQGEQGEQAAAEEPTEVKAAGVDTEEVVEPAAPAADGRVESSSASGTAIRPDISGTNIPGVRSQSGVTLQPYQAPMVSTPAPEILAPQVATTGPVTTVTPVQEAASEIINLTGTAMLPYATGAGAWVTAAGLGMLGAGAITWRRRSNSLSSAIIEG